MKSLVVAIQRPRTPASLVVLPITGVLLAGYTGRNQQKVMEHIKELSHHGIAPPERIPTIYQVDPVTVTTEPRVAGSGPRTSGEAEFYLVRSHRRTLVGVGSDHTDREHEAINIQDSKAICPKPVSATVWDLADVEAHWDALELRSWVTDDQGRRLYQEGNVASMLTVPDLYAALAAAGHTDLEDRLIMGGTLPLKGGSFVYGTRFELELRDPVLNRSLVHAYDVAVPGEIVVVTDDGPGDLSSSPGDHLRNVEPSVWFRPVPSLKEGGS